MQSGISASESLHSAFTSFTSDTSSFCLPVTIQSESLIALDLIPFSGDFHSSLPSLSPHLQPKTPIYLLLRKNPSPGSLLTAITYVPSPSPVRAKTLFASTRQSLVRELGLEKFDDTLFATDADEVLDAREWAQRAQGRGSGPVNSGLLTVEERELQRVKRAEEEERHGTAGKQLHMGEQGGSGVKMEITGEARAALQGIRDGELVQLGIDLPTESLALLSAGPVGPEEVERAIPGERPSYNFYNYPGSEATLFVYVCPGRSKVKERMIYASGRNGVLETARALGVDVRKRLELDAEDVTAARLKEEAGVSVGESGDGGEAVSAPAASKGGFARPKRPGRR